MQTLLDSRSLSYFFSNKSQKEGQKVKKCLTSQGVQPSEQIGAADILRKYQTNGDGPWGVIVAKRNDNKWSKRLLE